jgi:hypothetical protein
VSELSTKHNNAKVDRADTEERVVVPELSTDLDNTYSVMPSGGALEMGSKKDNYLTKETYLVANSTCDDTVSTDETDTDTADIPRIEGKAIVSELSTKHNNAKVDRADTEERVVVPELSTDLDNTYSVMPSGGALEMGSKKDNYLTKETYLVANSTCDDTVSTDETDTCYPYMTSSSSPAALTSAAIDPVKKGKMSRRAKKKQFRESSLTGQPNFNQSCLIDRTGNIS